MTAVSTTPSLKAGSLCLSLLAGKKHVQLTGQNLNAPLSTLFPPEKIASWPAEDQRLVDRIRPLFELTPSALLTREAFKDHLCIETQVSGIAPEKTIQEAFIHRLFLTALEQPNSPVLSLWHLTSHDLPISAKDWKSFPAGLKQFHGTLPLLKDLKVGELFSSQQVASAELTADQAIEAWKLWVSHFKGLWLIQSSLYQKMTVLASESVGAKRVGAYQQKDTSIFRKFPRVELQRLFWETPMSFLSKYEALAIFEKKLPFMEKQIALFKGDSRLLQALVFDHLKPITQMMEEISQLAEKMEATFKTHQQNKERRVFPDKSLSMQGNDVVLREAHQETINDWHNVSLNASIVALFSNHLLGIIRKNLASSVEESKGNQKLFPQLEASYRAQISYYSLALEDAELEETLPEKKERVEDAKEEETEKALPASEDVDGLPSPTRLPMASAIHPLQAQIEEDLTHLDQNNPIGSATPYAETVAELLEKKTGNREMGDHFFLMVQGLELLAACKEKECQPAILRSILIDGHVAMERALKVADSQDHNLAELSKMSQVLLSEDQKQFLQECPLALYWARYPACSSRYFGGPANTPPLFRLLLEPTPQDGPALASFVRHVAKLVVPPDLLSERWLAHIEKLASQVVQASGPKELAAPPFRDLTRAIQQATAPTSKNVNPELAEALLHLQEISHYLSWIEQGKKLQKAYPSPAFQFWHQRNELEVDKLFKHLYATDCILHRYGDPRTHKVSSLFHTLDEIRPLDTATKKFLSSFNLGIAHHYHTRPSPLKNYPQILKNCRLRIHQFQRPKKDQVLSWNDFDKAMQLFAAQLPFTLKSLSKV